MASGVLSVMLAWTSEDVINTLTIFYSLLAVGLFVPIVGGLYVPRTTNGGALASVAAGLAAMVSAQLFTGGAGWGPISPAMAGLGAAIAAWGIALMAGRRRIRVV